MFSFDYQEYKLLGGKYSVVKTWQYDRIFQKDKYRKGTIQQDGTVY